MKLLGRRPFVLFGVAAVSTALMLGNAAAQAQAKVRVALGDVLSTETLSMIIALERAKEKGVDYQVTHFAKEDLAIQAVINGQADLGVGTPYAVVQKSKAPLRVLFQGTRLVFFPVADKSYKTWKDMNGQPIAFHARATGTEAIGNIIAKREGIQFGERSYVPGSENRIIGMMKGQIKATIVDLANKDLLLEKAGDRFHVLPGVSEPASDETLFGQIDWIQKNEKQVDVIVTEFLRLWQEMAANPAIVEQERAKRKLMADQPKEVLEGITKFYTLATKEGVYAPAGGSAEVAKADFEFYTEAGQLQGPASALKVEDFWYLAPLERARKALGS
ncbi:NMT1/THI5 like protein [Bosea sp. LC85]|uniref:ABC transporter substrate-binding protein n=1 Tax=Bosea sp. LC85 TaxID=1502851 RepID=UPI0004E373E2|nr:ABC transporter substrate-binding protein [Bosea sp. LC85]KFC69359.1 NMT1/THI5 like protein [Bosea sp. LC85]